MTVNITLDRYRLKSDKYNWIVSERKTFASGAREGEEYDAAETFHGSLPEALREVIDRGLKDCDARSLEELRSEMRRMRSVALKAFEV